MRILLILICVVYFLSSCKRSVPATEISTPEREHNYSEDELNQNEKTATQLETTNRTTDKNINISSGKKNQAKIESVSQMFKRLQSGVFQVHTLLNQEPHSGGSGFFIAPGIGITNYHVLEGSDAAFIEIEDEFFKIQSILATSPSKEMDFVIFKADYQNNTILFISRDIPEIGNDVFAIGSPQGLSNSLTKGTISGFRDNSRIQIDATIDHGSSGGPLFNMQGEVIGITTSGLGTGSELNFAVNIQALPYQRYVQN